jgi:hypothetical protein
MEAGQLPAEPEAVGESQREPKRDRSLGVPSSEKLRHVSLTKEGSGKGLEEEDEFFGFDDESMQSDAAGTGDKMSEED